MRRAGPGQEEAAANGRAGGEASARPRCGASRCGIRTRQSEYRSGALRTIYIQHFDCRSDVWASRRLKRSGSTESSSRGAKQKCTLLAHALQYGTGVFEGMRSYDTADGPAIFRLDAHLERFYKSAALYDLDIPYTQAVLTDASLEVIRANKLEVAYLRPIAFFDAATLSVWTKECPVTVAIAAVPTGKYWPTPTPACA